MSVVLLELHNNLLVLIYFRCVTIMLTAGPNIETCLLNSIFAASPCSGLDSGALWHWKSSQAQWGIKGAQCLCLSRWMPLRDSVQPAEA